MGGSVPLAKAESAAERWSGRCASWLVGRDGGAYDRLEHHVREEVAPPLWAPHNNPAAASSYHGPADAGGGSEAGSPVSGSPVSSGLRAKELLGGVSGRAGPGELLAVMGPSGAGKTTLLQLLSGQKRAGSGVASGSVLVNGHARQASDGRWRWTGHAQTAAATSSSGGANGGANGGGGSSNGGSHDGNDSSSDNGSGSNSNSSSSSRGGVHLGVTERPSSVAALPSWAYVSQADVAHVGVLTVRETVEVAVALRLTLPAARGAMRDGDKARRRAQRAALLLDLLGLTALEHLLVGSGGTGGSGSGCGGGLSGGEAKRLTIAVELVRRGCFLRLFFLKL